MKIALKRIVFLAAVVGIWQIVFSLGLYPEIAFPSPVEVYHAMVGGFQDGTLTKAILNSFKHILIGLPIAIAIGTLIGVLLAKSRNADETVGMYLVSLQSIPSIVWVPLAILLFGFNETAVYFVIVMGGTFVMALNVRTALISVPSQMIQAARTMGVKGLKLFFKIEIPASLPHFVTGLRLAWAFGWRALMAGELLTNGPGLGYSIRYAMDFAVMETVVAIIIIIGFIGAVIDQLVFSKIERSVMKRWGLLKN
ncbi:ABC transporter permease [Pontibacillus sp. HMF3514]|uniref:ABC transporter permease n=1 Tax=Pontibacillus sp. HMF3514 TaxID=2692425 RepID=UPI0013201835|nr:ABC transporter permease [Pontibacillus sp. HMF3514]QHE51505.1 ABC transporter permease subunit [Pontibacillus sp. HMF3514]